MNIRGSITVCRLSAERAARREATHLRSQHHLVPDQRDTVPMVAHHLVALPSSVRFRACGISVKTTLFADAPLRSRLLTVPGSTVSHTKPMNPG